MSIEIYNRIMRYAGKTRNQVSNPCLTANDAIQLADCISKIEVQRDELLAAMEILAKLGNGDKYGSSEGNIIAQRAIAKAVQQ